MGARCTLYQDESLAQRVGYPYEAALAIATANNAVDSGNTSPLPIRGDQSYHFNRNLSGGEDSRLVHFREHYTLAEYYCRREIDNPEQAANKLGMSLHPLQDWVAHADYAMNNSGEIWTIHNSKSPQLEFGGPSGYPDDPTLDVVGSPDGRATKDYIVPSKMVVIPGSMATITYYDFAYYEKGFKRYDLTRGMTTEELKGYLWYVKTEGGCRCKKYFGVE